MARVSSDRRVLLWGNACHHLEREASRFIPSTRSTFSAWSARCELRMTGAFEGFWLGAKTSYHPGWTTPGLLRSRVPATGPMRWEDRAR